MMNLLRVIRERSGVAVAEFAVVLPFLLLVLVSVHDIAGAMWRATRLEIAARAGAQYALARPQDSAGITAAVRAQLPGVAGLTVAPTVMACKCDNGAAADCTTGICTIGATVHAPIGYISITVTQPFAPLSPLAASLYPGLSLLRGNVEMRLH